MHVLDGGSGRAHGGAAQVTVTRGPGGGGRRSRLVGRGPLLRRVEGELAEGRTVALQGVAGVGKTRVLEALARRHPGPVLHLGADSDPEAVPGPTGGSGPTARAAEASRPVLVLVDDAPLLDDRVAEQVRELDRSARHRVVTTSRIGTGTGRRTGDRAEPGDVGETWWNAGGWRHLEVAPLDRIATAQRLQDVLGALVEPELAHAVWLASGGHPVGIVEVVRDARETGCIELDVEAWRLLAPLPVRRLTALVGDRVTRLGAAARTAADVLALASPLPIHLASALIDPAGVRELEARGLARFRCDDPGGTVELADPMVAEVLVAQLSAERRRVLLTRLVSAFERSGPSRAQVARWRLEIGGWAAADLEAAACRAADADDLALAEPLAARAVELGAGYRSQVVLGVALSRRGEAEAAGAILRAAAGDAADPSARDRVAVGEAHLQAIGFGRWDRGVTVLERQLGGRPPSSAAELVGLRALLEALRGTPDDAARSLEALAGDPDDGMPTRVAGVASILTAAARLDAPSAASGASGASGGSEADGASPASLADDVVRGTHLLADRTRPLPERLAAVRPALEAALRRADDATAWWLAVAGWLHLDAGDLGAARGRLLEASLAAQWLDPLRLRPRILADLALIAASEGSPAEAEGRLAGVGVDRDTAPGVAARCAIAQALVDAQLAGPDAGAAVAIAAARDAVDVGSLRDAVDAWHLAVRLGAADAVVDELARAEAILARPADADGHVSGEVGAGLPADHPDVAVLRRHAERLAAHDGDGLAAVARDLAAHGRYLVAADAAAQAAELGGRGAAALAAGCAAACPGARTPALEGVVPVTLSPRRREVGRLAVRGDEGAVIAAMLGVSRRTVENHLGALYRDLGVANRRELRRVYRDDRVPFA